MIVTIDFETYFDSKDYTLSKMGPIEYIRDPRFAALCLGYCINDDDTIVVEEPDIASTLQTLRLEDEGTYVVGHNIAGFDALILSERYGIHPKNIVDTMHLARWCGISRVIAESHKALTDFLGHGIKQEGTVVSNGKRTKEDFTPEDWAFFKQYCADDVTQCSLNFFSMVPYTPMHAIKFGSLTARMATEPVIQIDAPMIEQYVQDIDKRAEEIMADLNAEFHFASREEFLKAIRSAPTFCSMLARYGAAPPMKLSEAKTKTRRTQLFNAARNARNSGLDDSIIVKAMDKCEVYAPALSKNDLEFKAMANDPNEHVAALVQARLELNSSIEKSRAVRLLEMSKSGRPLPVMLKAFYAHTGRYGAGSSEGSDALNMQNMSKRDPSKLTLRRALQAPAGHKFVSVDSSQIEARMLAYLAGETELVGHFREGRDPYAELAEKIFNVPAKEIHDGAKSGDKKLKNYRNVGKTAILSAGYGVGWRKFSDTLLRQNVMLDKNLASHAELAKSAHQIYRMSNPNIVAFWDKCQRVIEALERGVEGWFGGPCNDIFRYMRSSLPGKDEKLPCVRIEGPRYNLWYPNLHWEKGEKRVEYFYDRIRGKNTIKTKLYGGSLCENITQSIAFMLLMWQANTIDSLGIHLVANIHDAWIACVPEKEAEATKTAMEYVMSTVPPWLAGFPVACEGEIGDSYEIA